MTHDDHLFDADGQAKFFTGINKPVYQSLKALCGVGRKRSIISKEKFTNEDFALAVQCGVDVDAIFRGSERHETVRGRRRFQTGWARGPSRLTPLLMGKTFETTPSYHCAFHVAVKGMLNSFGGQLNFSSSWNRPPLLTRSKALVRSMKAM